MRHKLLVAVCLSLVVVGCSQLLRRPPAVPGESQPGVPGQPLTPVPELGEPAPAFPQGPTLEGPYFPDSASRSRGKLFVRPTAGRQPAERSIPLRGYVELAPSP
jgi:hypothetical protein